MMRDSEHQDAILPLVTRSSRDRIRRRCRGRQGVTAGKFLAILHERHAGASWFSTSDADWSGVVAYHSPAEAA
jgi:hypothetical protein